MAEEKLLMITFNFRTVDRHIPFPYYILLFYKYNNEKPLSLTAITRSKSNLDIMNINEEKYHQFLDTRQLQQQDLRYTKLTRDAFCLS